MLKAMLSFMPRFWANWLTLLGTVVTTMAGAIIALLGTLIVASSQPNNYLHAILLMIMPFMFIGGLLLIALGFLIEHRRKARDGEREGDRIQAAFASVVQDTRSRRLIVFVGVATVVNIVIVGTLGTAAISYMDSPEFCGTLCHSVMQPEYDTYRESPHARIKCVTCHIGPGASWAVKSKLDGLKQVWGVMTGNHDRPVPSPVHTLRPARDTCEQCHWPAKFLGNRVIMRTHYKDDEENSAKANVLMLRVGGKDPKTGEFHGIHWHVSEDVEIRYEALDEKRESIGRVQVYNKGELKEEFVPGEGAAAGSGEFRAMDCVDCHNRPTHVYDASPQLAVDRAMFQGQLDASVPFLHKEAVAVLSGLSGLDHAAVDQAVMDGLKAAYAKDHPDVSVSDEQLAKAAEGISKLYKRNIYPHLNLTWGVHPNHLGHPGGEEALKGCFRCHDDKHSTKDGKTISMDCELCHEIVAEDESPEDLPDSIRSIFFGSGN